MGFSSIITLLTNIVELLVKRESNYNIRLLRDLYNDKTKLQREIYAAETDDDFAPDNAYIMQLYGALGETRRLIAVLENSEEV